MRVWCKSPKGAILCPKKYSKPEVTIFYNLSFSHKYLTVTECTGRMNTEWFESEIMPNVVQDFVDGKYHLEPDILDENNDFKIRFQHDNCFLNRDNWRDTRFERWVNEHCPFRILYVKSFSPDLNSPVENLGAHFNKILGNE